MGSRVYEDRATGQNLLAVAVDKGSRGSRDALRWVIDHHLATQGQCVMLVHVASPTPTLPIYDENGLEIRRKPDETVMDVLTPYLCFCKLRQVQCKPVVLQHTDVAQDLREFILFYGVETFVLGGVKMHPFFRIVRGPDVQTNLEKNIPSFCKVYGIYQGRIKNSKSAVCPVEPRYCRVVMDETVAAERAAALEHERSEPTSVPDSPLVSVPVSAPASALMSRISSITRPDEFSFREVDMSQNHSERHSTESSFISFYRSLGDINRRLSSESLNKNIVRHSATHSRNVSAMACHLHE